MVVPWGRHSLPWLLLGLAGVAGEATAAAERALAADAVRALKMFRRQIKAQERYRHGAYRSRRGAHGYSDRSGSHRSSRGQELSRVRSQEWRGYLGERRKARQSGGRQQMATPPARPFEQLPELCEGVELHKKIKVDAEWDTWFELDDMDPPDTSNHFMRPWEVSHLITKYQLELFRREACRGFENFRKKATDSIAAQGGKSQRDLNHLDVAYHDNHNAMYCFARSRIDPIQEEQDRDRISAFHQVAGVCCCQNKDNNALDHSCSWTSRFQIEVEENHEGDYCALKNPDTSPYDEVAHSFNFNGNGPTAPDMIALIDDCRAEGYWKELMGAKGNKPDNDWKRKCETEGTKKVIDQLEKDDAAIDRTGMGPVAVQDPYLREELNEEAAPLLPAGHSQPPAPRQGQVVSDSGQASTGKAKREVDMQRDEHNYLYYLSDSPEEHGSRASRLDSTYYYRSHAHAGSREEQRPLVSDRSMSWQSEGWHSSIAQRDEDEPRTMGDPYYYARLRESFEEEEAEARGPRRKKAEYSRDLDHGVGAHDLRRAHRQDEGQKSTRGFDAEEKEAEARRPRRKEAEYSRGPDDDVGYHDLRRLGNDEVQMGTRGFDAEDEDEFEDEGAGPQDPL